MTISKSKILYEKLIEKFPLSQNLTELSRDENNSQEFIESPSLVFNLDLLYTTCHFDMSLSTKRKTPDAIFYSDIEDSLYMVEFKSGNFKSNEIRLKVYDAVNALFHFCMSNNIISNITDFLDINIKFCLIYRDEKKYSESFLNTLETALHKNYVKDMEGIIIRKGITRFDPDQIANFIKRASDGHITSIKYHYTDVRLPTLHAA
ncbi:MULTISPECIES: hypothetical protein [unclassified Acinetobacter]|uniref:hypothetical protein n=1 Tax=unclassified Acinetobacter TaxID=196816 RepID=UPI0015D14437|nr:MULTISPECIES: hypothetical protein [unclassified Acinetobacter]